MENIFKIIIIFQHMHFSKTKIGPENKETFFFNNISAENPNHYRRFEISLNQFRFKLNQESLFIFKQ